jgi:hypothetical protein
LGGSRSSRVMAIAIVAGAAVVSASHSLTKAAEVAIRAPVQCVMPQPFGAKTEPIAPSCGSDQTLAAAQSQYSKFLHAREDCSKSENKWACGGALQPFAVTYLPCGGGRSLGSPNFMAPVSDLPGASAALQSVLESAKTGRPFQSSYQIVEAASSTPDEQHLALCDIKMVAGSPTQPRNCETVAIITPGVTWLRARIDVKRVPVLICPVLATIRLTGSIDIVFKVQRVPDLLALGNALKTMLDEELKLFPTMTTNKGPKGEAASIDITSAAPLRNSLILPSGWREAMDFDISLVAGGDSVRVSGAAHVSVSRTAASNLTEYVLMSGAQRSQYATSLNASVLSAIKRACKSASVLDNTTVLCETGATGVVKQ